MKDNDLILFGALGVGALLILKNQLQKTGQGISDIATGAGTAATGLGSGISTIGEEIGQTIKAPADAWQSFWKYIEQGIEQDYKNKKNLKENIDWFRELINKQNKSFVDYFKIGWEAITGNVNLSDLPMKKESTIKPAAPSSQLSYLSPIPNYRTIMQQEIIKGAQAQPIAPIPTVAAAKSSSLKSGSQKVTLSSGLKVAGGGETKTIKTPVKSNYYIKRSGEKVYF